MIKRLFLTITVICLAGMSARAQYDASFSQYWELESYYNPASVGKQSKLNVCGVYSMDFVGFENNPQSMYVGADMPIYAMNSYHGVGVSIFNDQIGLFVHQKVALQYAYRRKLFGGHISAGVQVGMVSENFDGSKLDLEDSSDPAFMSSKATGNSLDLALGLYYTHKSWYAGLSVQHLNAPLVEFGETNELQIDRTYYLTCGYNIKLKNPFLSIPVSMLLKSDGVAYRGDLTGRLVYTNDKKVMYGGITYSPDNSITVHLGGKVHDFIVGYSYGAYTTAISPGNGSHELFVGYQSDLNLNKKGKNKHKSVRLL